MKNKSTSILLAIIAILAIALYISCTVGHAPTPVTHDDVRHDKGPALGSFDGQNISFMLDGQTVTLQNGVSETPAAPGSASSVVTTYFGNEAKGDLNADGKDDIAFLVTQNTGGSGLFYYAVVALKTEAGYVTTNGFLIGDRIAPQNNEISSLELRVNYAERKAGEPMSATPTSGAVKLLKVTEQNELVGLMK